MAGQLVADWTFEAIDETYLQDGRLLESAKRYFREPENAANLDINWPLTPNDNRVVFQRIQSIQQTADLYLFTQGPLEDLNFNPSEIDELIEVLQSLGELTWDRKLPPDRLPFFLNIDNALVFNGSIR